MYGIESMPSNDQPFIVVITITRVVRPEIMEEGSYMYIFDGRRSEVLFNDV